MARTAFEHKKLYVAGFEPHTGKPLDCLHYGYPGDCYKSDGPFIGSWAWCLRCGCGWKPAQDRRKGIVDALPKLCPACWSVDWWKPRRYRANLNWVRKVRPAYQNAKRLTPLLLADANFNASRRSNIWDAWAWKNIDCPVGNVFATDEEI